MNLTPELRDYQVRIEQVAAEYGLDCFEVVFEMLDYAQINEVAAYGGFPTRYPHWRHGMGYEQLEKGYRYGLQKIYELVINNDPCYAYLLGSNGLTDNKLVIAHVYGHCDFFKNNIWFSRTNRKMMDQMANHATRVRKLIDRHGQDLIEEFLERALSLENLVDLHGQFVDRPRTVRDDEEDHRDAPRKLRSKDYMDPFINPPEYLEAQRKRIEEEERRRRRIPASPDRDIMGFLLKHAPLERWEWELLHIVREEALYFAPQRATKIMNEGWATYWHRRIMAERMLGDDEVVDYADTMSATLAGGASLNPYKIGLELYLDIERRWNEGRHGLDYERCDDLERKTRWNTGAMAGREQLFLVRRVHDDIPFIDEYLTEEFCHEQKLFLYRFNPRSGRREIASRDFAAVKEQFLRQLSNGGSPVIEVIDANFGNRGELALRHRWDGQDLRADYAKATLSNVQRLWKRPVVLETTSEGHGRRFVHDGQKVEVHDLGPSND